MKLILILSSFLISCVENEKIIDLKLGDEHNNGVIFYLFKEGDLFYTPDEIHGLIVYKQDSVSIWGCNNISISAGDDRIGGGDIINSVIINRCNDSAALLCSTFGKEWYLPNLNEIVVMSNNRQYISNLKEEYYWTCNITLDNKAYAYNLISGDYKKLSINQVLNIRPIKRF